MTQLAALTLAIQALAEKRSKCAAGNSTFEKGIDLPSAVRDHARFIEYGEAIAALQAMMAEPEQLAMEFEQ